MKTGMYYEMDELEESILRFNAAMPSVSYWMNEAWRMFREYLEDWREEVRDYADLCLARIEGELYSQWVLDGSLDDDYATTGGITLDEEDTLDSLLGGFDFDESDEIPVAHMIDGCEVELVTEGDVPEYDDIYLYDVDFMLYPAYVLRTVHVAIQYTIGDEMSATERAQKAVEDAMNFQSIPGERLADVCLLKEPSFRY